MEDLTKSLQTDEELKKLLTPLSKRISAFEDHVWELALSKELAKEEVALHVNLALTATRPIIGNYFNGVLEGLVGSLGIKIHEDEDPPRSTLEGLERHLAEELEQLSVSAPSLEGCESHGLHVGYSLQYADREKGPSVPALSSMALPDLLDVIDHLQLGMSTPLDEDQSSEEQQDLLESLVAKGVLRSSKTKDVYQKFVNILDAGPHIQNPEPAPKPKVNPPVPPRQVYPPQMPATGNPTSIPGALLGTNWVLGKIPTDEEESKKLFSYRNPLSIKPAVPPPKVSNPIPPLPYQGSKSGEGEPVIGDPNRLGGIAAGPVGNTLVDHSRRNPSSDRMSKQEASTQEVIRPIRGILCPSKLPRRDLKYSEEQCTPLDSQGCLVGCVHLTDIAESERSSASESGAAKRKEPDTPDLGSEGASAPFKKQVKIEGATYRHGSVPSIHVGASLHDVLERDEGDNYEKEEEEEDEDNNNDVIQGDTPKDEDNEEEEDNEDDAQFVDNNPIPPKCWTRSQQAQQDEQESSLVIEILSDDEKQQKSWVEVQKASKDSASPSDGQPSSLGKGNKPVPEEADLQDPGNEDESVMKEVAKLNTKNRVQMKALSEACDQCYVADKLCTQEVCGAILGLDKIPSVVQIHKWDLFKLGPPGNHVVDDIHSHWESYFEKYGVLADAPYSKFQATEGWDTVYTWDSLEKDEPALTHTYGKKVTKPSLIGVVTPTTMEIGDNYFLNKLHEPACIKRRSVYYGAKVAGKGSCVQVVICPYCGVLSQNAPSGCCHIQRHFGLTFECGGCKQFHSEAPKKLQEHLGKCKEALATKAAAELAASQNETSKREQE